MRFKRHGVRRIFVVEALGIEPGVNICTVFGVIYARDRVETIETASEAFA